MVLASGPWGSSRKQNLVRSTTRASRCALRLVLRLRDYAVKRVAPMKRPRTTLTRRSGYPESGPRLPGTSTVRALEDDARLQAGRQQALARTVVGDRGDVLVRQAGKDVLPGRSGIAAVETRLPRDATKICESGATVTPRMLVT